jgi:hypothetical protein
MSQPNLKKIRTVRKPGRRGRCLFTQRAVERLYRAGRKGGMVNPSVKVHPDGTLSLVPGELSPRNGASELEQWQATHAHHAQGN